MNAFELFLTSEAAPPRHLPRDAGYDSRVQISQRESGKEGERTGAARNAPKMCYLVRRNPPLSLQYCIP